MIPLYKPFIPEQLPELDVILHSGALSYGKWGKLFEAAIKNFIGCEEMPLVVNSFTAAIQVVLSTLNIKPGDEIIASPQCCLASTQPLVTFGAKVVWADIDPLKGTLDPDDVTKKITPKTRIIWHNHHCGYPGYIDEINDLARLNGIISIDDCIEAFGAEYKGSKLGNVGTDITVFSFQTVRLPNAIDGGGIIFRDQELYCKAVRTRDLGVNRPTFRDSLGEISSNSDVDTFGYGVTANELSSYIGCLQMNEIEALLKQQRSNASFRDEYSNRTFEDIWSMKIETSLPNYWVYGLFVKDKAKMLQKFRELGYYASGVHLPNSYYSIFGQQDRLNGVEEFYKHFIALPCGWWFNNQ